MLLAFVLVVVEGTVVNAVTGAPISGVTVNISGDMNYRAKTDDKGAFRVADVKEGQYSLYCRMPGFIDQNPIRFRTGSGRLRAELTPAGRVSGRVVDAERRPVAGVTVDMIHTYLNSLQNKETGKNGEFAFTELQPGSYYLVARPGKRIGFRFERQSIPPPGAEKDERLDWGPTFYPAATDRHGAARIVVAGGANLEGYEVRLRAVPVHRIRGTVFDPQGRRARGVTIFLSGSEVFDMPEYQATSDDDGTFEFAAVRDGAWRLEGRSGELRAFGETAVAGGDMERVELRLTQPFTVEGRLEAPQTQGPAQTAIWLTPADVHRGRVAMGILGTDGRFQFNNVYQGRYRIRVINIQRDLDQESSGLYLASVRLGDREVFGEEFDVLPGSPPIAVVYKANAGRVRGAVEDGEGSIVVVIPQQDGARAAEFPRTTHCELGGKFEIGGLRPGAYYVFASRRFDTDILRDPVCWDSLARGAVKVDVKEGEAVSADLRLMRPCEF